MLSFGKTKMSILQSHEFFTHWIICIFKLGCYILCNNDLKHFSFDGTKVKAIDTFNDIIIQCCNLTT